MELEQNNFYTVRGYHLLEQHRAMLSPSLEDYMEMIYRDIMKDGEIRVKSLASRLHVKPPSASKMIQKLAQLGFINYRKYGSVTLTERGNEMGKYLLWRHEVIRNFFQFLPVHDKKNEKSFIEVELTEHILGYDTVLALQMLLEFFHKNPEENRKFQNFCYGNDDNNHT